MTNRSSGTGFKPSYSALARVYPHKALLREQLFDELGIQELTNNAAYANTCGIRMSYGATKAGVILRKGGLKINKGPFKGKRIEPGMRKLAEHLAELWGSPEKYESEDAATKGIAGRKGVAAFFFGETLPLVSAQGHIDLVKPGPTGLIECVGACFFGPKNKVWFWPLD